jgi:hypothetical protein
MGELFSGRLLQFGINLDIHELVLLLIQKLLHIHAVVNRAVQLFLMRLKLLTGVFSGNLMQNLLHGL